MNSSVASEDATEISTPDTSVAPTHPPADSALARLKERQERFKTLQARQHDSRTANRKETHAEAQRLSTDPAELTALNRRRAIAAHKLSRAEAEADGEDFERKRAWDWTVEESEKWDRRMAKKEKHRDDNPFQDYSQNARKVYKRQMKQMGPADMEAYERSKQDAIERAAKSGRLEVVETDDGELVAVDKDGTFYSTEESTGFVKNKPDKAAVDRLVEDLKKADDARMKKRRERGRGDDESDVTFINEKNRQFNMKLARFYNKYTQEIRENFERGTAI